MTNPSILEINVATGEQIERPMTDEEVARITQGLPADPTV